MSAVLSQNTSALISADTANEPELEPRGSAVGISYATLDGWLGKKRGLHSDSGDGSVPFDVAACPTEASQATLPSSTQDRGPCARACGHTTGNMHVAACPAPPAITADMGKYRDDMILPVMPKELTDHPDLRVVSGACVEALLTGHFRGVVGRYAIVDCRYKFEYDGGHIKGAIHCSDPNLMRELFFASPPPPTAPSTVASVTGAAAAALLAPPTCVQPGSTIQRMPTVESVDDARITGVNAMYVEEATRDAGAPSSSSSSAPAMPASAASPDVARITSGSGQALHRPLIIIMHCEFSKSRGPDMIRTMRNYDRHIHFDQYPALSYPQLCLLHGGYKAFFNEGGLERQQQHCDPPAYCPMLHPDHKGELGKEERAKKRGYALFKAGMKSQAAGAGAAGSGFDLHSDGTGAGAAGSRRGRLALDDDASSSDRPAKSLRLSLFTDDDAVEFS